MTYNEFRDNLLGKPSVISNGHCAVCGRRGVHKHHVIPKGMGGVKRDLDKRIPLIELCPMCHADVHDRRTLHLYWSVALGGWCYWKSNIAMDDQTAFRNYYHQFRPLPGWIEQKRWGDVIGGRR